MRLHFAGGRIDGSGMDETGRFTMTGSYDEANRVRIAKRYATHLVRYQGSWDGAMISGKWTILQGLFLDGGPFEMWPESDEEDLRIRLEETDALTAP